MDRDLLHDIAELQARISPFSTRDVNLRASAERWVDKSEEKVRSIHSDHAKESAESSNIHNNNCVLKIETADVDALINKLKEPRALQQVDVNMINQSIRSHNEQPLENMPEEFSEISEEEFQRLATMWRNLSEEERKFTPPPLNVEQRALCRDRFKMVEIIARGRTYGEDPTITLQKLHSEGYKQVNLTQGGAGVGKSFYVIRLRNIMRQRELGGFVVTAWTGVAAAPYAAPTLCTLLSINCRTLSSEQKLSVTQIAKLKLEFTKLVCDPKDIIIWAVDEVSFLAPEVLFPCSFWWNHY